jgi:hypothetical protein
MKIHSSHNGDFKDLMKRISRKNQNFQKFSIYQDVELTY